MKLLWLCCENEEKPEEKTEDRKKKTAKSEDPVGYGFHGLFVKKLETLDRLRGRLLIYFL